MESLSSDANFNSLRSFGDWTPGELERRVLDERARLFASDDHASPTSQLEPFIAVRLGGDGCYGIPYDFLDEILPDAEISPVPCVPRHVLGVTTRRGELLTVLNLAVILGESGDAVETAGRQQVVVVSSADFAVGLFVQDVLGYDEYDPQLLTASISSNARSQAGYFAGTWAQGTTMLNISTLLTEPSLVVNDHDHPLAESPRLSS